MIKYYYNFVYLLILIGLNTYIIFSFLISLLKGLLLFDKIFDAEIEEEEYLNAISDLVSKKNLLLEESDKNKKKDKIYRYMLAKGYESDLIVKELDRLVF